MKKKTLLQWLLLTLIPVIVLSVGCGTALAADYGRVVAGDFNGDGKADIAGFYDHGNAGMELWAWNSNGNGFGVARPGSWTAGNFDALRVTGLTVAGDFNGDGKCDIAVFYDYGNANTSMLVWDGSKGLVNGGATKWNSGAGAFEAARIAGRVVAGDFNGDGKCDIAAFYDYGNSTGLWVWYSNGNGFNAPVRVASWAAGNFDANRITGRTVAGDFNGDGKCDIAVFYDYGNANTSMLLWDGSKGLADGGATKWNSGAGAFDAFRISGKIVAGDFNGDGKCDIAAFYDYGNGTGLWSWNSNGNGFNAPTLVASWSAGNFDANRITGRTVAGDFSGDGKCDIAVFYDYGNANTSMLVWDGSKGLVNGGATKWNSGAGNFEAYRLCNVPVSPSVPPSDPTAARRQAVVNTALAQLGKPYVWGAAGPSSFDCSGLCEFSYKQNGLNYWPGRGTTATIINYGVNVKGQALLPGDLVWPSSGHLMIYIGNGKCVEAPAPGYVVRVSPMPANPYAVRRYIY